MPGIAGDNQFHLLLFVSDYEINVRFADPVYLVQK